MKTLLAFCCLSALLRCDMTASNTESEECANYSLRELHDDWITTGHLYHVDIVYEASDYCNDSFVYVDNYDSVYKLTDSPRNVEFFINSQCPDGVDAEFISGSILPLIYNTSPQTMVFWNDYGTQGYLTGFSSVTNGVDMTKEIMQVLTYPEYSFTGNAWRIIFTTCSRENYSITINYMSGRMRPFAIDETRSRTILHRVKGIVYESDVQEAVRIRSEVLSKWNAESMSEPTPQP